MLEIIKSEVGGQHVFRYIKHALHHGQKDKILSFINDETLKDFLGRALEDDCQKRATIKELLNH